MYTCVPYESRRAALATALSGPEGGRARRINKTMKTGQKAKKLWHHAIPCFVNAPIHL